MFPLCSRMCYQDFVKTFTHLEAVHLDSETSRDEPTINKNAVWHQRLFQGSWQRGVTAGGCRNHPGSFSFFLFLNLDLYFFNILVVVFSIDCFHINPQLHLAVGDSEEVVVSLNQHSILEPKVIGFTAYSLPNNHSETIGKAFFKRNKSLLNSQYTNSRQVGPFL